MNWPSEADFGISTVHLRRLSSTRSHSRSKRFSSISSAFANTRLRSVVEIEELTPKQERAKKQEKPAANNRSAFVKAGSTGSSVVRVSADKLLPRSSCSRTDPIECVKRAEKRHSTPIKTHLEPSSSQLMSPDLFGSLSPEVVTETPKNENKDSQGALGGIYVTPEKPLIRAVVFKNESRSDEDNIFSSPSDIFQLSDAENSSEFRDCYDESPERFSAARERMLMSPSSSGSFDQDFSPDFRKGEEAVAVFEAEVFAFWKESGKSLKDRDTETQGSNNGNEQKFDDESGTGNKTPRTLSERTSLQEVIEVEEEDEREMYSIAISESLTSTEAHFDRIECLIESSEGETVSETSHSDDELEYHITPTKTPSPKKPCFDRILPSEDISDRNGQRFKREEEPNRRRLKKLSKLGEALRKSNRSARSYLLMWQCDDEPQEAAMNIVLESTFSEWGVYWTVVRDRGSNLCYIAADREMFKVRGSFWDGQLDACIGTPCLRLYKPFRVVDSGTLGHFLLGARHYRDCC